MNIELVCDIDFAGQGKEVAQPLLVFHDKFLSLPDLEFGRSARVLASSQYKQILVAIDTATHPGGKIESEKCALALAIGQWPMFT